MMNEQRILIVDDDPDIRGLLAMFCRDHRYCPCEAGDGEEAMRLFRAFQPDLVLLDVGMKGLDGFEVCKRIRLESDVPIIFLTSRQESEAIITGLEIGGDDYIIKPFQPEVLLARIRANLRRFRMDRGRCLVFNDLVIDRETYEARYQDRVIPFMAKEIKLLIYLAERPRRVYHVEQLYAGVWNTTPGDVRTVMVHISHIRQKLQTYAPGTVRIETVKGIGYRLIPCAG